MADYMDVGGFSKKVTTVSADCQLWMNRAFVQTFGFNHEEAIRCCQKALTFDRNCPMAHYLISYNNAADYNNPLGMDYAVGYWASQKAREMAKSTPKLMQWERALIEALVSRFCWPVGAKLFKELHRDYATAMHPVYLNLGNDPNIAAMYAESLMMLAPWSLWTSPPDVKPAIPETEEVVAVLEKALKKYPNHPGLCHYYIHVMELSATPERALPAADMLCSRIPGQGHLVHMPSHIYMWLGRYHEAIETNKKAVEADEIYITMTGQDNEFYKMLRLHNYHFAVWACMFTGQFSTALKLAETAERQIDVNAVNYSVEKTPVGTLYLEAFAGLPWHVLVRFGKWQKIIDRPMKEDRDKYAGAVTIAHYAKAIAYAVTGQLDKAEVERRGFNEALANEALKGRYMFCNVMHDADTHGGVLDVAEAVMNGELEYFKGNVQTGFEHLRLAMSRDDNLCYDEPWGWMIPVRHVLGALLLDQGEVVDAETLYREDLVKYKNNMWSLLGLSCSLRRQGKTEEADKVHKEYLIAKTHTEEVITSSCMCAKTSCCE